MTKNKKRGVFRLFSAAFIIYGFISMFTFDFYTELAFTIGLLCLFVDYFADFDIDKTIDDYVDKDDPFPTIRKE